MRFGLNCTLPVSSRLGTNEANSVPRKKATENYGKVPMSFESNQGQTAPEVRFFSRGPGYGFYLTVIGLEKLQVANFSFTNSTKVALFPSGMHTSRTAGMRGLTSGASRRCL